MFLIVKQYLSTPIKKVNQNSRSVSSQQFTYFFLNKNKKIIDRHILL